MKGGGTGGKHAGEKGREKESRRPERSLAITQSEEVQVRRLPSRAMSVEPNSQVIEGRPCTNVSWIY